MFAMQSSAFVSGPLQAGSTVQVRHHTATVESYLAQGGFAHVYAVSLGSRIVVLKRLACPDDATLRELVYEAETHKKVSGHENIVEFIDYQYNRLPVGGYELLLLMEYCPGGHLVDYLNTRLANRPSESEVLRIFSDVCEAVAHLHSLSPPVIHRDIKIENVLLKDGKFKLSDFGSCTTKTFPANTMTMADIKIMEDEIAKFTTLQYRSPEICDLYLRREISTKVDMWAMGVLLYKLCFFTTPFEDGGRLAILNSKYVIPNYPTYSTELTHLMAMLLEQDVQKRLDIYQTYNIVCQMRKTPYRLSVQPKPVQITSSTSLSNGPFRKKETLQEADEFALKASSITPMRRGRPGSDKSMQDINLIQVPSQESVPFSTVWPEIPLSDGSNPRQSWNSPSRTPSNSHQKQQSLGQFQDDPWSVPQPSVTTQSLSQQAFQQSASPQSLQKQIFQSSSPQQSFPQTVLSPQQFAQQPFQQNAISQRPQDSGNVQRMQEIQQAFEPIPPPKPPRPSRGR
ncbi:kinase-like domain-containing protein [Gorgonomyces haynaldii]|nr:kinase-like domain-containing protein [Gorgonomyces haynaldii]